MKLIIEDRRIQLIQEKEVDRAKLAQIPEGTNEAFIYNTLDGGEDGCQEALVIHFGPIPQKEERLKTLREVELQRLEKFYDDIYEYIKPDADGIILNPYTAIQIIGAWKKKAELFSKFMKEADKEVAYDLGASQHLDNQMNQIQKMCRKMTDETDETILTALPHRILQVLGIPTCPACGYVASKSPCKYCGNDVGMAEGTG